MESKQTQSKPAHAEPILDSFSPFTGTRLLTVRWTYPKLFDAQAQKHGSCRNNSESARARGFDQQAVQVTEAPYIPQWTADAKTMWGATIPAAETAEHNELCLALRDRALYYAQWLVSKGVHRQDASRYLTPWALMTGVATADESAWESFVRLRIANDAQPAMATLAKAVQEILETSRPVERLKHAPLAEDGEDEPALRSAARCARVSYGGERIYEPAKSPEHELVFARRLWKAGHVSPFEHACDAMVAQREETFGPYFGWLSYRQHHGGARAVPRDWRT